MVAFAVLTAACASSHPTAAPPATITTSTTATTTTSTTTSTSTTTPAPTSTTTTAPASFSGAVSTVTVAELGATYHAGCPVGPASLRMLRMSYWGFDDRAHVGTMVVNAAVTRPVLSVFATLFRDRFPIRLMQPVAAYGGSDPESMAADNTSGFNCRDVVAPGPPRWSEHAYGEAIDVNTVENPYVEGGTVQPPAGTAYFDRTRLRPGMAGPGTVLNAAFAAIGWFWGGHFNAPDYQHFSKNGG